MFVQSLRFGLIAAMFTVLLVNVASAQRNSCDVCGEEVVCKKVCCLKCEFTEVKFRCYKSEFEDICVPCPSERCGDQCVSACLCKDGADGCGQKKIFGVWQPSGAEVKTRRRLMYKTVTKKVPTFKWELKTRCHECCKGCCPATEKLPEGIPAVPPCAELIDVRQAQSQLDREQPVSQSEKGTETQAVAKKTVSEKAVAKETVAQKVRVAQSGEAHTATNSTVKKANVTNATVTYATATNATVTKATETRATVTKAAEPKTTATNRNAANDHAVIKIAKPVVRSNTTQQGNSN